MLQVLIADDEETVADGLARFVSWEKIGYEVGAVAYSVEEALEVIKTKPIDVVLTDIMMGEKTGLELLEEALVYKKNLKAVILSGHENFKFAQTAIKLGVYDYLVKPADFEELETIFLRIAQTMKDSKEQGAEVYDEQSEGIIIGKVKEYIELNYHSNITLTILAEQVYVHPAYLSTLFKKKVGKNYKEYLSDIRILHAKELLGDVSLRVSDVAFRVGYDGPKHFSKMFKEITGMTPKDYRNHILPSK